MVKSRSPVSRDVRRAVRAERNISCAISRSRTGRTIVALRQGRWGALTVAPCRLAGLRGVWGPVAGGDTPVLDRKGREVGRVDRRSLFLGYAPHKQEKYKEAAAEYRVVIAGDPSYLLAHDDLACVAWVASLQSDLDTALRDLAWVAHRAIRDPAARSAVAKARIDRDLAWIQNTDVQAWR